MLKPVSLALTLALGAAPLAASEVPAPLPVQSFAQLGVPAPPALSAADAYQTNTVRARAAGTDIAALRAFMDAHPVTDYVATTDAIPKIVGFEYLSGTWPTEGAVRRVDLADGSSVHERVLTNTPDTFAYQIWNISSGPGRFVDHIKGEFTWVQDGPDVDITWDYNVRAATFIARPFISRYLRNDFAPFMAQGMDGVMRAHAAR